MQEAAKKARELKLKQTAFTTINKHLSTISPLFKWVAQKPEFAGLQNPCTGLFHDKVKGNNPRPSLPSDMLNVILSSPLFTGFQENGKEHKLGDCLADDWRKWIPLIVLFTGARIGEVAQLRLSDIRCDHGIWYFLIAHDEKAGLTTKSGESRIAVMHNILQQELRFIDFVERRLQTSRGDTTVRLFAELVPNGRGQIGDAPSRWWRKYLKNIQVKSGADGFGAHSFRHGLADRLRVEADLLDTEVAVCLGHVIKSTTSGYGSVSQGTFETAKRVDGSSYLGRRGLLQN
ncbi:tyrosine-type recombinase/integrase [Methylocucumis oryzae]|nr:tyrosine-type recombinase/integrase [Methylocucumis oryzae]